MSRPSAHTLTLLPFPTWASPVSYHDYFSTNKPHYSASADISNSHNARRVARSHTLLVSVSLRLIWISPKGPAYAPGTVSISETLLTLPLVSLNLQLPFPTPLLLCPVSPELRDRTALQSLPSLTSLYYLLTKQTHHIHHGRPEQPRLSKVHAGP